jgi:hypothetical protein
MCVSERLLSLLNADHILMGNLELADVDKQLQDGKPAVKTPVNYMYEYILIIYTHRTAFFL